jgi:hypothetical protein
LPSAPRLGQLAGVGAVGDLARIVDRHGFVDQLAAAGGLALAHAGGRRRRAAGWSADQVGLGGLPARRQGRVALDVDVRQTAQRRARAVGVVVAHHRASAVRRDSAMLVIRGHDHPATFVAQDETVGLARQFHDADKRLA